MAFFTVAVFLVAASGSLDQPQVTVPRTFRVSARGAAAAYAVVTVKPFHARGHRIAGHPIIEGGDSMTFIDGKFAWGTGGGKPQETPENEVGSIRVRGWGRWIKVPSNIVRDLYNIGESPEATLTARSKDRLELSLCGSDGYAGYTATWTIRRDGRVTRKMEGPGA